MPKLLAIATLCLVFAAARADAVPMTLIDGTTPGFYNQSLGSVLDGTNYVPALDEYLFPSANSSGPDDPTIDPVPFEPDLSAADMALGNWLTDPTNLNANWSGLTAIPPMWALNTETAIIYEIDAGPTGLSQVMASFGVDNGIFVWLDGVWQSGQLDMGPPVLGEHVVDLGNLSPGVHHLQVLREDHGQATGYVVEVTHSMIPEPSAFLLMGAGLAWIVYRRKCRRHRR